MSQIRRLDPAVADQIAAGEVVERPASVVKELTENALDAGARHVVVTILGPDRRHIVVDDDGTGMDRDDVLLSVERHATSKLTRLLDLDHLTTMGFRGEALAAIGAVSRLMVESRPREGADVGYRVVVDHGHKLASGPVARAPGTRVECEDLFRDVPARLKALPAPASEWSAMWTVVASQAVAHPGVAWTLMDDAGDPAIMTPGDGSMRSALSAWLSADLAARLIPVDHTALGGEVRVEGYLLPPDAARGNRRQQVLVVNGRVVRNFALRAAAESGFGTLLADRRYPAFWLSVAVPGPEVDPNAHPAKAEVRLMRERVVAGIVHQAVADALRSHRVFPFEEPREARGEDAQTAPPLRASEAQGHLGLLAPDPPDAPPPLHREISELVPLAQWYGRYLLCQGAAGLYLIDQHAAHERIYYDRAKRSAPEVAMSQPLLVPLMLNLSRAEASVLESDGDTLRRAGFDLEPMGGSSAALRAVPALLADVANAELVAALFDTLVAGGTHGEHPVSWAADHALATAACRAAVKANRPLAREEMAALIAEMAASPSPRSCPHGRPTLLVLTVEEVDRRFGRR
jgi:DNA mismatch repair protein MutL